MSIIYDHRGFNPLCFRLFWWMHRFYSVFFDKELDTSSTLQETSNQTTTTVMWFTDYSERSRKSIYDAYLSFEIVPEQKKRSQMFDESYGGLKGFVLVLEGVVSYQLSGRHRLSSALLIHLLLNQIILHQSTRIRN